jgi:hypothetical protein
VTVGSKPAPYIGKRHRPGHRKQWRFAENLYQGTFHEFTAHSIHRSVWARAYFDQQIGNGAIHAVVRTIALKWIHVMFRCWKNRTAYEEPSYPNALEQHGSPLANLGKW